MSSEDDGDTEDDTHICRVLRAYYTEKGRPYPQWLPPDPKEKRAITPQPQVQQSGYMTSAGGKSQYSNLQTQGGQRGSLSDLWDTPTASNNTSMQPQSLRNARRPMHNPAPANNASLAPPQARPLPSQRAGSYQSVSSMQSSGLPGSRVDPSPPTTSSGMAAGSAQERLKARLWGGKGGSTTSLATGNGGGYDQPQMSANAPWNAGSGNQYDSNTGGRRYGR